jgi:tRNA modification GTPase
VAPADERIVARLPTRLRRVVVHNKVDLASGDARRWEAPDGVHISLSALTGMGVELLHAELLAIAGWHPGTEDVFMARERHLRALEHTAHHLRAADEVTARPELFAEELRLAQDGLGQITGEFTADNLLGEIFSRFCIGK